MAKKLKEYLLDMIYPKTCPLCGRIPDGKRSVCISCRRQFPVIRGPRCLKCSKPILNAEAEYCYDCMEKKHHYISGKALWIYDDRMRQSIARFKYRGSLEYADIYGEEMVKEHGNWIRSHGDVLVPVPLHKKKEKIRGYNQAQILADAIGKRAGLPVNAELLYRSRDTRPQKELNDKERLKNLSDAFRVKREKTCLPERVILVDDIYTTGSTIEACTTVLQKAGFSDIYFISICIGKGF